MRVNTLHKYPSSIPYRFFYPTRGRKEQAMYAKHLSEEPSQAEKAEEGQVENNAGGFVFKLDNWARLERFLILGSDAPTYYCSEKKLTVDNALSLQKCLKENPEKTVDIITTVSTQGRAVKNDAAIFALALACADEKAKKYGFEAIPKVCRTGTHLFQFVEEVKALRGWGTGLKKAIGKWYTNRSVDSLAYQLIKYQQRKGMSHRDVFRLTHVAFPEKYQPLIRQVVTKDLNERIVKRSTQDEPIVYPSVGELPLIVQGWLKLQVEKDPVKAALYILDYKLPWEAVPTPMLNCPEIWEALLEDMLPEAMLRNLNKMTAIGLLTPFSAAEKKVKETFYNVELLKKVKLHPIKVLVGMRQYNKGRGDKGSLAWAPLQSIVETLDDIFYKCFQNITPSNERYLLNLDVSGSMTLGTCAGMPITPREASAAMAMVTARTEANYHINGFSHELIPLKIHNKMAINDVVNYIDTIDMGGTDCALPMLWALKNKVPVDKFIVYTDNETWYGKVHPYKALQKYRDGMGIASKLIVVGMTSTKFTIADPSDNKMLDVVGFDTAAPAVISEF